MSGVNDMPLRKTVDQLKRESCIERCKISMVSTELKNYCEQNIEEDYLLTGALPPGTANPYKDKKMGCSII